MKRAEERKEGEGRQGRGRSDPQSKNAYSYSNTTLQSRDGVTSKTFLPLSHRFSDVEHRVRPLAFCMKSSERFVCKNAANRYVLEAVGLQDRDVDVGLVK